MSRMEPVASTGTQTKTGTARGPVPGHDVTAGGLSPARGFPAGVAIAVLAAILVGTLVFALFLAPQAPDLSPEGGAVILRDDDVTIGGDLGG